MDETPRLADLALSLTEAALSGNAEVVLDNAAAWLRAFTRSDFVVAADAPNGMIARTARCGRADHRVTELPTLPLGRGAIVIDEGGNTHAVHDDARRIPHSHPVAYFLGMPMYAREQLAGMVYLTRPLERGHYIWREQLCVRTFAIRVAEALDIAASVRNPTPLVDDLRASFIEGMKETLGIVPFDRADARRTIETVVAEVNEAVHVDAAHVYLPIPEQLVVPTNLWLDSDPERYERFKHATAGRVFPHGNGLPGRVLTTREISWIDAVETDGNFPRVTDAVPVGIKSAAAFPIRQGGHITAIVECFFTRRVKRDDKLVQHMDEVTSSF